MSVGVCVCMSVGVCVCMSVGVCVCMSVGVCVLERKRLGEKGNSSGVYVYERERGEVCVSVSVCV